MSVLYLVRGRALVASTIDTVTFLQVLNSLRMKTHHRHVYCMYAIDIVLSKVYYKQIFISCTMKVKRNHFISFSGEYFESVGK